MINYYRPPQRPQRQQSTFKPNLKILGLIIIVVSFLFGGTLETFLSEQFGINVSIPIITIPIIEGIYSWTFSVGLSTILIIIGVAMFLFMR